jgi:hypothetical protein
VNLAVNSTIKPTHPLEIPEFRDVAGDVGRRAARPWTAEAPPPAPKLKLQRGKAKRSGKKQGTGFADGEGSDSDDDDWSRARGGHEEDETLFALKAPYALRKTTSERAFRTCKFNSLKEYERRRLRRSFLALDEKWKRAQILRKGDIRQNAIRELHLKRLKRSWDLDSDSLGSYERCLRQTRAKIQEEHEAMQLLTKEAFADRESREQMLIATQRDDYLEQILFLIEDSVILDSRNTMPPSCCDGYP